MADDIIVNSPDQTQIDNKSALDQQMAIALNGGIAPQLTQQPEPETQQQQTVIDSFGLFKDKFGWEAPEAAIKEIEELRAYRATPIVPEIKFENKESEEVYKALQAGKIEEVYSSLEKNRRIDKLVSVDLTKDTAADIVKLGMQLKYKDLSPEEIAYKFNKQFSIPPKPVIIDGEDQEDFQERLSNWESISGDKSMELMIEAKLAKPEIQASKSKLVFPEIGPAVDPDYLQWKKSVEDEEKMTAQTLDAYKQFTPKTLETKINFNDEANKIAFEFQYEPDQEGFQNVIDMTTDINKFYNSFTKSDGTPDRQGFAKALYFAKNGEKLLLEAMKQAKNATIKASLPDNSQGGLVRQLVTQPGEPSELDKQMANAGIRR